MRSFRRLLAQRRFAALLCAATLLLKLLVPTGFMVGETHGHLAITVCPGMVSASAAMPATRDAMPGHGKRDHGKTEMPCAFSGLSAAMTAPLDAIQLAALIVFIIAVGLVGVPLPSPGDPTYLRPPLRAPPALS